MRCSVLTVIFSIFVLLASAVHAAISCSEYEHHKQHSSLHKVMPENLSEEQRCEFIPEDCGSHWLLFNPTGIQTYYYRSACYYDLALKRMDVALCDKVVESKSLLLDGSHYSPQSCRDEITGRQRNANAPKISPENIVKLASLQASIDEQKRLHVTLLFSPGTPAGGTYAISLTALYNQKHQKQRVLSTDTIHSFNPIHPAIRNEPYYGGYDNYGNFNPISQWLFTLTPEMVKQGSIELMVEASDIKRILTSAYERQFTLEAQLQFLGDGKGGMPNMEQSRKDYISRVSYTIKF